MPAPDHAPDLDLRGAAAASDLPALLTAAAGTPFGGIVTAYLTAGYAAAHPDLDLWSQVPVPPRWIARDIASRCLEMPDAFLSVA